MDIEKSISRLDDFIGEKVHIIAFGTSYLGILCKVDYDGSVAILNCDKDKITIDLERIESFTWVAKE